MNEIEQVTYPLSQHASPANDHHNRKITGKLILIIYFALFGALLTAIYIDTSQAAESRGGEVQLSAARADAAATIMKTVTLHSDYASLTDRDIS